jgi:bacteriocin biosynthesis cyclodehydratase domain-containing protein
VMRLVAPALLPDHDPGPSASERPSRLVAIDAGEEPHAATLRALLTASGMRTIDARSADRTSSSSASRLVPDAVVISSSFVVSPDRYGAWLSRDIPHLPIVFGDRVVEVGPFVQPGAGPCLRCISLHRRDADAAWPVIAAQLERSRAATLTPVGAAFAMAHAGRMLDAVLRGHDARWATRCLRIDVGTGRFSEREHRQHPECGCRALPENVTALPRRSAERHDGPSSTTTASWHA